MSDSPHPSRSPKGRVVDRAPIVPERVRRIGTESFAFLPHRFLREGFLQSLESGELRLYLLLVLAGDRNGISYYHYDSLCARLELSLEDYLTARNALIDKDLIATDGTRIQVLSLPPHPVSAPVPQALRTAEDFESHDPATIRALCHASRRR